MSIAGRNNEQAGQSGDQHHQADRQNHCEGASDVSEPPCKVKAKKTAAKNETPHGKQTVEELIGQNQGVSTIPIANTEPKGFERVAKKYGVDFAIRKDASVDPPRYTVFFKAKDEAALTAACKEYTAQALNKQRRPSVRKTLNKLIGLTAATRPERCGRSTRSVTDEPENEKR